MRELTRRRLNAINQRFYRVTAREFDATRQRAWPGWPRTLSSLDLPLRSVLDIGCGNGRFARFLADRQAAPFRYCGVDTNADLLALARCGLADQPGIELDLIQRDVVLSGLPGRGAQLVTLFGLLHHVPGAQQRRRLLAEAADCVEPGGWLAFTAWRFLEDERLRQRIVPWDDAAEVEAGDYLLDWRRGPRALRYCHYIDDAEHERLIAATGLMVSADFRADGAGGALNRYTLLTKKRAERDGSRSAKSDA